MKIIGVQDVFGESGTPEELIAHYGLETKNVIESVKEILK